MQKIKEQLVLRKDDYEILLACIRNGQARAAYDRQNIEELETELKKAKLVNKDEFPQDVVRLNSTVKVKEENKNNIMELTLVTPEKADIRKRKISVMAPIGTALIGFQKGKKVDWKVPSGKKTFTILDVINSA